MNGTQYRVKVRTKNVSGIFSSFSDSVLFYCYSTPIVNITNVNSGDIINSSSFEFTGSYSQAESESLESYIFYLYNSNSVLLSSSTENYDGLLKHTFSSLQDNGQYKIELKTRTINGVETSSGLINFSVNFISPIFNTALELENINDQASVKLSLHVLNIIGEVGSGSVSYENNEWINLKNGSIYFEQNFNIQNDFTLKFWCKDITENETLIELLGENGGNIIVKYLDNKFHLYKNLSTLSSYYIYSDDISLLSTDVVCVQIQQIGNLMSIQCGVVV